MTPSRPYLIRALYEWIADNGMTPYILVNAEHEQVEIPQQFVENGKIVFNISPTAVRNLELGNDSVVLEARFAGTPMRVAVPVNAVLAIYARENGKGMVFTEEGEDQPPPEPSRKEPPAKRPSLRVVK
jgi:stringent starvation protein B